MLYYGSPHMRELVYATVKISGTRNRSISNVSGVTNTTSESDPGLNFEAAHGMASTSLTNKTTDEIDPALHLAAHHVAMKSMTDQELQAAYPNIHQVLQLAKNIWIERYIFTVGGLLTLLSAGRLAMWNSAVSELNIIPGKF